MYIVYVSSLLSTSCSSSSPHLDAGFGWQDAMYGCAWCGGEAIDGSIAEVGLAVDVTVKYSESAGEESQNSR